VLSEVVVQWNGVAIEMGWYWYGNGDVNDFHVWNGGMVGISGTWAGMRASMECWNAAYLEAALD